MKRDQNKMKRTVNQFPVIVHADEKSGYWVECPVIEGCYSQGETIDEALDMIQDAIELCLEDVPKSKQNKLARQRVSLHMVQA